MGGKKYDTFTTNSKNVVVVKTEYTNDDDDKGEVFLPLQFFAGKYHLEEVKVPDGFIGLGKTQSFEMSGLLDFSKDEDGDPIYTVTVIDEQPKGSVHLTISAGRLFKITFLTLSSSFLISLVSCVIETVKSGFV